MSRKCSQRKRTHHPVSLNLNPTHSLNPNFYAPFPHQEQELVPIPELLFELGTQK